MTKIILKQAPAIAPRGNQLGVLLGVKQETGTDAVGAEFNHLNLVGQLDAKDAKQQPYQVAKSYNLQGRGFSAFCKDFKAWSGRSLTQDEIEGFDPDLLITGQKVIFKMDHRKEGDALVPVVKGFAQAKVEVQSVVS